LGPKEPDWRAENKLLALPSVIAEEDQLGGFPGLAQSSIKIWISEYSKGQVYKTKSGISVLYVWTTLKDSKVCILELYVYASLAKWPGYV
jgi:hypothetical protein